MKSICSVLRGLLQNVILDLQKQNSENLILMSTISCHNISALLFQPLTLSQMILDCSKLEEFPDDNFKSDERGRKLVKQVENTVGKGEIARYEQFLLFPQKTQGLFGKGLIRLPATRHQNFSLV